MSFPPRIIHEGEYISIPTRRPLPINSTTSSVANSPALSGSPVTNELKEDTIWKDDLDNELASKASSLKLNNLSQEELLPLVHRWSHTHSILSVVAAPSKNLVLCGTQDSKILIVDINTYSIKHVISCGHNSFAASVLCLTLSTDENYLFSAGSDSLVKIWDLTPFNTSQAVTHEIRCTHIIYSLVDIGDIFSITWSEQLSALFIGAQNASILWCKLDLVSTQLNTTQAEQGYPLDRLPHLRFDKFFDSKGPGGSINRAQSEHQLLRDKDLDQVRPVLVEISHKNVIKFAHNGYVYCMSLLDRTNATEFCELYAKFYSTTLVTCGGDGVINVWGVKVLDDDSLSIEVISRLENDESILSMHVSNSSIYVGLSNSSINSWDLTTFQLTRSFHFVSGNDNGDEILSLCINDGYIYKATNTGGLCRFKLRNNISEIPKEKGQPISSNVDFNQLFPRELVSVEHNSVFAVQTFRSRGATFLVSGGAGSLCLWNITNSGDCQAEKKRDIMFGDIEENWTNEHMLESLKNLISFKTISKYPSLYLEDSRECARYISRLLMSLGATDTRLLPVPDCNPLVYAKFTRNHKDSLHRKPVRVLWYGHYDVVEATDKEAWNTDPFSLTATDGVLYARGVSDNKGPILAAIYAVAELHSKELLSVDVVFIIEGEEECGSIGFQDIVLSQKKLIGEIDWIMLSNSYWIGDDVPCLNYGLRGVLNASIVVESDKPDRHSGVDGGVSKEPTMDLVQILGSLMCRSTNRINISGFYDDVLPLDETELSLYEGIKKAASTTDVDESNLDSLLAKWRNPSLTIHRVDVSGPKNNTVISQSAQASVSIRVVPNQELAKIKASLVSHLERVFAELKSENRMKVNIFHEAEPWLGDPTNLVYQILYKKMKSNWGPTVPDPLFIREGGSIPSIRFLEKSFDAPAAQIPCGQASDNAHLQNEKLRIINLYKLKNILFDTFQELGLA
ncbi:putative di- and tripeptidase [Clavispora lusitaniae]|uniref:Di-and tripeptidase n=1 Tax=Clavispora lusitaniae TaxID=36911 RepID=A0ACD0WLY0_CLALS|nr:putative di- and tripeptidase [Clavispora lusitaniae]QFZ34145.1 putative di- and tripeptidase [Clavispora lusitaniae]QFZ39829.1 putative di- and tripeptidase [Clavispora lusitaniae]QFZ45511.1 putative di- and tripeptidase [Clavispora lusitaniae]QFZ51175.1 putative di- and tripeptidase [Clavispora lusitaniae]